MRRYIHLFQLILATIYVAIALYYALQFAERSDWLYFAFAVLYFGLAAFMVYLWRSTWPLRPKKSRSLKSLHPDPSPSPPRSEKRSPWRRLLLPSRPSTNLISFPPETLIQRARKLDSPVIGFRCWQVGLSSKGEINLYPLNVAFGAWNPGVNEAVCKRPLASLMAGGAATSFAEAADHKPAEPHCHCGFWIKDSFRGAFGHGGNGPTYVIVGVAMGWGRVQAHMDGWRAQYASPIAFSLTEWQLETTTALKGMGGPPFRDAVKHLSLKYDVPLFRLSQLEDWFLTNTEKGR